jgi:hypothetical protein
MVPLPGPRPGPLEQARQLVENGRGVALGGRRLAGGEADVALGHGETRDRVDHAQHRGALVAEVFGQGQREVGGVAAHECRLVGGGDDDDGAAQALLAEIVLQELLHLAAALADEPDDGDLRGGEARHHGQEHRLADARAGEDAHALAAAGGQEGVDGAHAEVEGLGDAAAGVRRRRIGPERIERAALRQRALSVYGTAEGVDDAAEPGARWLHAVHARAHMRRAAAAHALEGAERHGEGALAGEADHLARHHGAAVDLDIETAAEMHRRHRPGDFDEEAAHGRDAPEHAEVVDAVQRRRRGREPAHGFVLRLHAASTFRLPVSLTLAMSRL